MHGVQNMSEALDHKLMRGFKEHKLGLRHASFKWSTKEGIINDVRMNYYDKTQHNKCCWNELL